MSDNRLNLIAGAALHLRVRYRSAHELEKTMRILTHDELNHVSGAGNGASNTNPGNSHLGSKNAGGGPGNSGPGDKNSPELGHGGVGPH